MIVTVTLNPAIDVTYVVDRLAPGEVHRVRRVVEHPGGKGVNVARVLHQLGHPVTAAGLVGGATGERLASLLAELGLPETFVRLGTGESRRCVTVVDGHRATVLNEPGPTVSPDAWQLLAPLTDADVVVLSGSLPPGLPEDTYAGLARLLGPGRCLVDTSGPGLVAAASAGVAVVKPNADELATTTGQDSVTAGARALLDEGAGAVVVTLGSAGIMAVTSADAWRARQPEHLAGNPTGAGDAAAAALAAGLASGADWPDTLREAVAWSAAAVPVAYAGEVDVPTLERLRAQVWVEEVR